MDAAPGTTVSRTHAQLARLFGRPVPEDVGLLAALGGSACRRLSAI